MEINEEKGKEDISNKRENKNKLWIEILVIVILSILIVTVTVIYSKLFKDDCNDNITNSSNDDIRHYVIDEKPIIYLYPENELQLSVKLGNKEKIICSYPKYESEWNIIARPDGTLIDLKTNRKLYALYYESENATEFNVKEDGFIVKGTDTVKFLEEKLEILGLTEREAEEFIVYWLPKLECNKYNYIRFATEEEIRKNMPLEISVKPDTEIRVLMIYKGLNEPTEVQEQQLKTPERKGFVAVEWGGTELK